MRFPVLAPLLLTAVSPTAFGCSRPTPPLSSPTDESVQVEADGDLPKAKAAPRGAAFRWQQRAGVRIAADGSLRVTTPQPAAALVEAHQEWLSRQNSGPAAASTGAQIQWRSRGPGNIGGRVRALLIHPTRPSTMWAGTAGGGVWLTIDSGASWRALNSMLTALPIGSMALDPTNPNRLYAGTGEGFFDSVAGTSNLAAMRGAGIFVSNNGGLSWSQLPSTRSWGFVNRIVVDPRNTSILLVATTSGIYRSTDRGQTFSRTDTRDTMDLDMHPTDSSRVIAGTGTGLALYSTNGGQSFAIASGVARSVRVETAYYRASPNTVYAAVSEAQQRIRIYRSNDGGRSYTRTTSGQGISTYSRYNSALWVDPTDSNRLWIGGVRSFRSTNGGATFTQVSSGGYYDYHVFAEEPGYDASTKRTIYSCSDGGVHRIDAVSGTRWTELNNNLSINQFYGAAISSNGAILAGAQDQGTVRVSGTGSSESWRKVLGGDGGFCAADPTNPNYMYGEIYWLRLYRSTNGGSSFRSIRGNINEQGNFIPPMVLDPNNPNRMLAGGRNLWRNNAVRTGSSWQNIKPGRTCATLRGGSHNPAHFGVDPPCNICAIAVAPGNSDVIWVGHNDGHIYVTTNGTSANPSWTRVDAGLPDRWIGRIVPDPNNANTAYVSLMGYVSGGNVFKTTNRGQTWTSIAGSGAGRLPDVPVPGFAVSPSIPGTLFAGTDLGLFFSVDDGATWQMAQDGPGPVAIEELVWHRSQLLVVTHGRGAYLASIRGGTIRRTGSGCPLLTTLNPGYPAIGSRQLVRGSTFPQNSAAQILVGGGAARPTPLGNGCTLYTDTATMIAISAGTTGPLGDFNLILPIPASPALFGATITMQGVGLRSGGPALGVAALTAGWELTYGL